MDLKDTSLSAFKEKKGTLPASETIWVEKNRKTVGEQLGIATPTKTWLWGYDNSREEVKKYNFGGGNKKVPSRSDRESGAEGKSRWDVPVGNAIAGGETEISNEHCWYLQVSRFP